MDGAVGYRPPRNIGVVHWMGVRTLYARELRRYLKEWLETIAASAFATIMYLAIFLFALGPARETAEGAAVIGYILPGLVLFSILTRAAETTVFSIAFDKMEGAIGDVLSSPITPSETAAAYALAGATSGLITGLPVVLVAFLVFDMPAAQPWLLAAFALGGALMLSLTGMAVGIWADKWDHVSAFFGFFLIPFTFLSGLFAPIDRLPQPLAVLVQANPIFYVIDGFRAGAIGVHTAPVWLSLTVVAVTVIVLWAACDRLLASGWKLKP